MERKLGKKLTAPDVGVLLGLNDYLGLPADVIYLLVCHCAERVQRRYGPGRRPGMKQIEREGYAWARRGIDSQGAAAEYLKNYARRQERVPQYMRVLGLGERAPAASEEKYLTVWQEMGFPPETVALAYDKTVDPAAYTMTRNGDTVTFQFKEPTSISGLKITGDKRPASGSYTVTVEASFTDEDKKPVNRTVTARAGDFNAGNQAADGSYLTYFQKPGAAGSDDTRIWTYDAKTVTVAGIPTDVTDSDICLVSYAGDDVAFWENGAAGRLSADYRYGDGADDVIPEGTLVIVGTYRGDPRFNTVKVKGLFTKTTDKGDELTSEERYLDGYALMFAEIPADKQVSDISDGLFLFVPNVQKEAELQEVSHCDGVNLLPSQMKAVLSRTDLPDSTESQRVTAETLWTLAPGGEDLPVIVLEGGNG